MTSIHPSIQPHSCTSFNLSIHAYIHLLMISSIQLAISSSIHLSFLSIYTSVHLSIRPSIDPDVVLPAWLSVLPLLRVWTAEDALESITIFLPPRPNPVLLLSDVLSVLGVLILEPLPLFLGFLLSLQRNDLRW